MNYLFFVKLIKTQVWLSANENVYKFASVITRGKRKNSDLTNHLQPLRETGSWVWAMGGSVFGHWSSSSSEPWQGCCPQPPPLCQESVGRSLTSVCSLHSDHEDWPFAHVPENLTFGCSRREEGWKRPGSGKGQIKRKIIKHGMERKRYLSNVWFHKNSCDGLFWNCKLPFLSLYQIPLVKQYILLGCSLQKPHKLSYIFLKNCIKRPSCNTNPIPRIPPISKQHFEAWLSVLPTSIATFNVEQPDHKPPF